MAKKVIIVGGGLSGSLVALHLTQRFPQTEIIMIEKNPQLLGRGIAYHYDFTHQPLNVTASGMSLFHDKPDHFFNWIEQNSFRYSHLIPSVTPKTFVPRKIFGDYIVEHLQTAHSEHSAQFQIRIDEVLSVRQIESGLEVSLDSGIILNADHVILALGNFPPADIFPNNPEIAQAQGCFSNPWTDQIYSHIKGSENILLVGTGLTAVDVVLGLKTRNFRGNITMLSRKGKLPLPHDLTQPTAELSDPGYLSPRDTFLWVRNEIRHRKETSWQAIIDGLRPLTQVIWQRWNTEEKKFFLQRIRPFWEVVRHRIPVQSSTILEEMTRTGQLVIGKGKIESAELAADGIKVSWSTDGLSSSGIFQKVVNCTGPESDYRKVKLPVLTNLMQQNLLVNDALGLGIQCTSQGNILDKDGEIVKGLWCIGPMRKAVLWETTAIRELRTQAWELSQDVSQ